jgi:Zn-dependent protease
MFGSIQIGRAYGIPVRLHWTMLLFLPYLALRLAGALGVQSVLWGWVAAFSLFASVLLHELGHSVIARGRGYPVRDIVLTPIGGVAFLAKAPRRANDELAIAIAGPVVSLLLAIGCWLGAHPLLKAGLTDPGNTLFLIGSINMTLVIFNLIPCFPMDGGRVYRALRSRKVGRLRATAQAVSLGKFFAWTFGLYGLFAGNWILVIIAFVVHQAAAAEYRLVQMQEIPPLDPFPGFRPFGQTFTRGPQKVDADDVSVGPPPYER